MTRRIHIGRLASALFAALFATHALAATTPTPTPPVTWDVAGGIAGGSACTNQGPFPDTWLISAGDQVSVIFSRMGIDLTPESTANTAVHSCLVRIPISVDGAVAIGELDQTVYWGYAKDLGTEAQLSVKSTFLNLPTTPITAYLDQKLQGVEGGLESTVADLIPTYSSACKPVTGFFQMNLGVAARRTAKTQNISVRVAGEDIMFEALVKWIRCPK